MSLYNDDVIFKRKKVRKSINKVKINLDTKTTR